MKTMYSAALLEWPEPIAPAQSVSERCRETCQQDLEQLENGVSAQVLLSSVDPAAKPVRIQYRGRTVMAQPLNARRFVQEMAAHISFN